MVRARTMGAVVAGVALALRLPAAGAESAASRRGWVDRSLSQLPLYFVENHGQLDPRVSYFLDGRDMAVYFADEGFTFALAAPAAESILRAPRTQEPGRRASVTLDLVGPRRGVKPEGSGLIEAAASDFQEPRADSVPGIRIYASLIYREVWPGIDLRVDGRDGRMEYTFTVKPGADPGRIRMRYRGADWVGLAGSGALEVATAAGSLSDQPPHAYQERDGREEGVEASYALKRDGADYVYSFDLGQFDRTRPLVIDPVVLAYCGYIGGSGQEMGYNVAVDAAGSAYVTGQTDSAEATFPVAVGPDLTYNGGVTFSDAFVAKAKADGTGLVYAGYIGGNRDEWGYGIAVDALGTAYVTGQTTSSEAAFPVVVGPHLTFQDGYDVFVAKVKVDGTDLLYAGYIGGNNDDYGYGIAVDAAGSAYASGWTESMEATFPVAVGPDLTYNFGLNYGDAFVAKVRTDGAGLIYAGYIGGSADDWGNGVAVDAAGYAYVAGDSPSTGATFPVAVGPDLTSNGKKDAFVAKVKADGAGLVYAGYIGGSNYDNGTGIAVDAAGSAYITGETESTEATFPVAGGPELTYNGNGDAFVAKVRPDGTGLAYSGYIGGDGDEWGYGIAVDAAGSAYVTGQTYSTEATFPVAVGPDLTSNGAYDAYVAKVTVRACMVGSLGVPGALLGIKDGSGGALFEWGPDPNAVQYHLNSVTAKADLRDTDPTSPRQQPQGQGMTECTTLTLNCTDVGAIADPRRLIYYQALSACGRLGSDEGPMCLASRPCP